MRFGFASPCLAIILVLALLGSGTAHAQGVQRIAAVVNDEVVSMYDLFERLKLVVFSSGLQNTPDVMDRLAPQVLRALIDERLRMQEAKRQNVAVTESDLETAMRNIEQRNQLPAGAFHSYLQSNNVDPDSAIAQLRAEIAWAKLVGRRSQEAVTITDEDIDAELQRLRESQGQPEYRYSEIFLIVESVDQDRAVRDNARQLVEQIRSGGDFVALARQFSAASTAARGGEVGWSIGNQLASEVVSSLASLEPGEVSDPIMTSGGYLIVQLHERRRVAAPDPDDVRIDLRRLLLPLPRGAAQSDVDAHLSLARTIRDAVADCEDLVRFASETEPDIPSNLGVLKLGDLAPEMRLTVRDLRAGDVSEPLVSSQGVQIFMVCDRVEPEVELPSREAIESMLVREQLDRVSRRYLRELRRTAFIDIRV